MSSDIKKIRQLIKKIKSPITLVLAIVFIVAVLLLQLFSNNRNSPPLDDGELRVHFIDCGQGDAALILLPNGQNIMIDTGTYQSEIYVSEYLKSLKINKIDSLILSHTHSDHIGGAAEIIDVFDVGRVIMPDISHLDDSEYPNSPSFEKLLKKIDNSNLTLTVSDAGDIFNYDDVKVRVLSPFKEYKSQNNTSLVIRLEYGNTSFLFTGDSEKEVENDILKSEYSEYLSADVLKIAHHGSSTSSTEKYINKINPSYAIISCGEDNDYGHPHRETVALLNKLKIQTYRTDKDGTVIISSNGNDISVLSPNLKK